MRGAWASELDKRPNGQHGQQHEPEPLRPSVVAQARLAGWRPLWLCVLDRSIDLID